MNTPENSIVLSWWDYGYWITGLSERITLIDNATLGDKQIERVATIFLSSPDDAWTLSRILDVDYLVVFVVGESLHIEHEGKTLYTLGNGGDESKVHAFIKIIGVDPNKYLHPDASFKNNFLNETLLGKLIPFTPLVYHNFVTQEQSLSYKSGYTPIFIKDIKLNSDTDTPFNLVYGSSSFTSDNQGPLDAILVYKINENYKPSSETPQEIIDDFMLN
jgi:dolichyl-diphosphooligosaccharide--protein glycosyltransferase